MDPGGKRRTLPVLWTLGVMTGLFAVSVIPGTPPPEPTVFHDVFGWFSPAIHNFLHLPAYGLLAWTSYHCLSPGIRPRTGAVLVVLFTGFYGAALEWLQIEIPGRYASYTDIVLNILGAAAGAWLASKNTTVNRPN